MFKVVSLLRRWGLSVLMMGLIFAFSSIPSKEMPNFGLVDYLIKKSGHAIGYGLLALAFFRGLRGDYHRFAPWQIVIAWVLATIYSATDELHQSFVPGRHPAITDVLIDSVGAATALFIAHRYLNKKDQPGKLVSDV